MRQFLKNEDAPLSLPTNCSQTDIIKSFISETKIWHQKQLSTSDTQYTMLHYAFCILGDETTRTEYNCQLQNWDTIKEQIRHRDIRFVNKSIKLNVTSSLTIIPETRTTIVDVGVGNVDKWINVLQKHYKVKNQIFHSTYTSDGFSKGTITFNASKDRGHIEIRGTCFALWVLEHYPLLHAEVKRQTMMESKRSKKPTAPTPEIRPLTLIHKSSLDKEPACPPVIGITSLGATPQQTHIPPAAPVTPQSRRIVHLANEQIPGQEIRSVLKQSAPRSSNTSPVIPVDTGVPPATPATTHQHPDNKNETECDNITNQLKQRLEDLQTQVTYLMLTTTKTKEDPVIKTSMTTRLLNNRNIVFKQKIGSRNITSNRQPTNDQATRNHLKVPNYNIPSDPPNSSPIMVHATTITPTQCSPKTRRRFWTGRTRVPPNEREMRLRLMTDTNNEKHR